MEENVFLGTKGLAKPDHPNLGFLDKVYLDILTILPHAFKLPSSHVISTHFFTLTTHFSTVID